MIEMVAGVLLQVRQVLVVVILLKMVSVQVIRVVEELHKVLVAHPHSIIVQQEGVLSEEVLQVVTIFILAAEVVVTLEEEEEGWVWELRAMSSREEMRDLKSRPGALILTSSSRRERRERRA